MNEFPKKINTLNTKNTPFIKIPKIKNLFQEQKKINEIKEKSWNSRFVYNKSLIMIHIKIKMFYVIKNLAII